MNITLEMVQKAYKAIDGEGKAIRADYFGHAGTADEDKCCGLSAIYLEKNKGTLGDVNHGLSHLDGAILDALEEEPDDVIPEFIMEEFEVSRHYVDGWMMGFDNGNTESQNRALERIERNYRNKMLGKAPDAEELANELKLVAKGKAEWQRGFDTGKHIGDVIFAVKEEDIALLKEGFGLDREEEED